MFFISPRKGTGCNDKKRQIEEVRPRLFSQGMNVLILTGAVLFLTADGLIGQQHYTYNGI